MPATNTASESILAAHRQWCGEDGMGTSEKSKTSRAYGKNVFCVFDRNGELYTHTTRLLSHAIADAKACGGEIWIAGRCSVPSWNVR